MLCMPAKLVKSGSNVADLITSAGLFGNALAKVRLSALQLRGCRRHLMRSRPSVQFAGNAGPGKPT